MKWILLLVMTIITLPATTIITLLLQYYQTAQAFPCIGDHVKEYCIGYHDGAIQANRDFKTGQDLDIGQRSCVDNITRYCNGYNDEADFLG